MHFYMIDQYWKHNRKLRRHSVYGIWRVSNKKVYKCTHRLSPCVFCQNAKFRERLKGYIYEICYWKVSLVNVDKLQFRIPAYIHKSKESKSVELVLTVITSYFQKPANIHTAVPYSTIGSTVPMYIKSKQTLQTQLRATVTEYIIFHADSRRGVLECLETDFSQKLTTANW